MNLSGESEILRTYCTATHSSVYPNKRVMNTGMFWAFVDPHGNFLCYGDLHAYSVLLRTCPP